MISKLISGAAILALAGSLAGAEPQEARKTQLRGFTTGTFDFKAVEDMRHDWNANFVRLMLGAKPVGEFMDAIDKEAPNKLAPWLDKVKELGITPVIDLHGFPMPNKAKLPKGQKYDFWGDDSNLETMLRFWRQVATLCKDREQDIWFDIYNEPLDWADMPSFPKRWPDWSQRITDAIREIDKTHPIVVEVGPGGLCWGFKTFQPLKGDNIIYSIHNYQPHEYTHQGIKDIQNTDLAKAYLETGKTWPGRYGDSGGGLWDKERLRKELAPAIDFQRKYGARIYVGEFGVIKWAPDAEKYLRDNIELFEELGWDWTAHAFREYPGWSPEFDESYGTGGKLQIPFESKRAQVLLEFLKRNK